MVCTTALITLLAALYPLQMKCGDDHWHHQSQWM